jgi:serine phosphatase RsbU (regulator of sigma subunit)
LSTYSEIAEKVSAAEQGKGEIFDAYMAIWANTQNIQRELLDAFILRVENVNNQTTQAKAWSAFTEGLCFCMFPETGNPFEKLAEALSLFQQNNDQAGEGMVQAMLSLYYKNIGELGTAQECVTKAISSLRNDNRYFHFLAAAYFQGGAINLMLQDYDVALEFLHKGLAHSLGQEGVFEGRFLSGIGNVYKDKNELEVALEYFQKSLKFLEGKNNLVLESKNYSDIGSYYYKKDNYEMALEYQLKSLAIRKELRQSNLYISNYIELAEIYLKQNKLDEALGYGQLAEKLADDKNIIIRKYQADYIISRIYEAMGKLSEALEYYRRYHHNKDQVTGQENVRKIKQLSMHHEMETMQKEKEIFRLRNVVLKEALDEIGASVRYAKRIQEAILPPVDLIKSKFDDAFVLYKPKDVVAGDFYWMEEANGMIFLAVADCTGHGVPGALVSVVCSNSLNRVVHEYKLTDPAQILEKTTELVCRTFEKSAEDVKDGMDISLLVIDKAKKQIFWSGANNPLWYFQGNDLNEIGSVKRPVGKSEHLQPFITHAIEMKPESTFYLFTDGFADQFGGPKGKKYKYKQLKEKLRDIVNQLASAQHKELEDTFENWRGKLEQIDDVCIIGVKI